MTLASSLASWSPVVSPVPVRTVTPATLSGCWEDQGGGLQGLSHRPGAGAGFRKGELSVVFWLQYAVSYHMACPKAVA